MDESLSEEIDRTLSMLGESMRVETRPAATGPLDDLFITLQEADEVSKIAEAEDLIWALWCSHENEAARTALNRAIGAMSRGEFEPAESLLDELVERWPDWAEVWNKRATLYFLLERYTESVHDIQCTLRLERRHFGALAGLGQICLKVGNEHCALIAFDCALAAHPGLTGIRQAAESLRTRVRQTLH